jgi:hypothetical protein
MKDETMYCPSHNEIKNTLNELREKVSKFEMITLINGKERKVHLSEIVKDIYYDVEVIRDLNKVHSIFKKYRIYFLILLIILLMLGINYEDLIIKILK